MISIPDHILPLLVHAGHRQGVTSKNRAPTHFFMTFNAGKVDPGPSRCNVRAVRGLVSGHTPAAESLTGEGLEPRASTPVR